MFIIMSINYFTSRINVCIPEIQSQTHQMKFTSRDMTGFTNQNYLLNVQGFELA